MRFDWLTSFLAFAEEGNFTRAAKRLHLSQPALHLHVSRLGDELGAELYVRRGRSLVLTQAGKRAQAYAHEVLQRHQALRDELQGTDSAPPVVSAGRGIHLYLLAEPLRDWVSAGGSVALHMGDQAGVLDALCSGSAHLGIAPLAEDVPGILTRNLRSIGQVAIVPEGHHLHGRTRIRLEDLAKEELVLPPADRPHRLAITRALRSIGETPKVRVEAGGWELMMHLAALGLGVAIVNDYCVPPPGTRAVRIPELPKLELYLLEREGAWMPDSARELARVLRRSVR